MSDAKLNEGINDDVTVIILSDLLHFVAVLMAPALYKWADVLSYAQSFMHNLGNALS